MTPRPACAAVSAEHDEPLHATASWGQRGWVLLEHPGPWPRSAPYGALPPDLAPGLRRRMEAHRLRLLLIRRSDRRAAEAFRCVLVGRDAAGPWMEQRLLADHAEVLGADLAAMAAGRRPGFGASRSEPFIAICTHGRKDACCAQFGRPTMRALDVALPSRSAQGSRVWECTHIGGDRFAANLVAFPHALYFGRVTPPDALRVANTYFAGAIALDRYRGRFGLHPAAQAAEHFVRRGEGLIGVGDVTLLAHRPGRDGIEHVRLGGPGRRYDVQVRLESTGGTHLSGCGSDAVVPSAAYALVHLDRSEQPQELLAG